jgi:hypothetical protein
MRNEPSHIANISSKRELMNVLAFGPLIRDEHTICMKATMGMGVVSCPQEDPITG